MGGAMHHWHPSVYPRPEAPFMRFSTHNDSTAAYGGFPHYAVLRNVIGATGHLGRRAMSLPIGGRGAKQSAAARYSHSKDRANTDANSVKIAHLNNGKLRDE